VNPPIIVFSTLKDILVDKVGYKVTMGETIPKDKLVAIYQAENILDVRGKNRVGVLREF